MTDKEKLLALLSEFGVTPIVNSSKYGDSAVVILADTYDRSSFKQDKVIGYTGFFCMFDFEPDGTFIDVGIWE